MPVRLMKALSDYKITNMSAAATHYRMMKNSGKAEDFTFHFKKLSYTGEPIDPATLEFIDDYFKVPACSMYGTTEIGVVLVNYPGANDFKVKPGSLGKAVPGQKLEVQTPRWQALADPGEIGELMLWRRDRWETTKDLAKIDEDGYFYHCGRADDVIISAGWTMSAVEIENTMLKHPDVKECAVIGAPDDDARAGGQGVRRHQPRSQRCLRQGIAGLHARAPRPARIPAHCRIYRGTSQDPRRQGPPQGAARPRGGESTCLSPDD